MRFPAKYIFCIFLISSSLTCLGQGKRAARRAAADTLAAARDTAYSDIYLDTVKVDRVFELNDYTLIGLEYGVSFSQMMFNPTYTQTYVFSPNTFSLYYIRYGKLFGYQPYFGIKAGFRHTYQGYKMKENKETQVTPTIEGATQALMEFVEMPLMAHFHYDALHYKVMADLGIYGGYRLNIKRTGEDVDESLVNDFKDTDKRFDYGLTGGLGFGIVYEPFEFHVNASVRYGWGSIYAPDYYSKDYYRYAYPLDVMVTAGVYFQLTRRTGRGRAQLKREAYNQVYNPTPETKEKK